MSATPETWNPKCIRERFEIVKAEVVAANTRNKNFLVIATVVSLAILIVAIYVLALHEKASSHIVFIYFVAMVGVALSIIYIIINSSEKCVSRLSICLLSIDNRQQFFKDLQQVHCGGEAITNFFTFTDKATEMVKAIQPSIGPINPPETANEKSDATHAK